MGIGDKQMRSNNYALSKNVYTEKVVLPEATSVGKSIQVHYADSEYAIDGDSEFDELLYADNSDDSLQQRHTDEFNEDSQG